MRLNNTTYIAIHYNNDCVCYLNADKIVSFITTDKNGSKITTDAGLFYHATESVEEIMELIKRQ